MRGILSSCDATASRIVVRIGIPYIKVCVVCVTVIKEVGLNVADTFTMFFMMYNDIKYATAASTIAT